jgi:transcriptional regulator with GAF, ATPase, and Fis domain
MSKFDLRDISERLASSGDIEAVAFEFLGYLQANRSDWRASLSFYDVSRDALHTVYSRQGDQPVRHEVGLAVDRLPPRLVRKFFQPRAFSNAGGGRPLLGGLFQTSPCYEPDPLETPALKPLLPLDSPRSCVCLPLADHEDLIALLILASDRKGAFGRRVTDEIVPLKNVVTAALARHVYRSRRQTSSAEKQPGAVAEDVQKKIRRLDGEAAALAEQNRLKAGQIEALHRELEALEGNSGQYHGELGQVKAQLDALGEQSAAAAEHLRAAQVQVLDAVNRVADVQRTLGFMKEIFQVLGQEYDSDDLAPTVVTWFCEHFHVERCSLMLYDESKQTLQIGAYRGLDAGVAGKVRVKMGQGISGWVAHHRKPMHVQVRGDDAPVQHTHQDAYNSDSFISVPLVYGDRLLGVLNLSNKSGGVAFTDVDLDRATLVGSVLAMILGSREGMRRVAVPS